MLLEAKWLIAPGGKLLSDYSLQVQHRRVVKIEKRRPFLSYKDMGPGAICLGLINCHTHLWLSEGHRLRETQGDFLSWTRDVIQYRGTLSREDILRGIHRGMKESHESGTYILLDIEPMLLDQDTRDYLEGPLIREEKGPWPNVRLPFLEIIGRIPPGPALRFIAKGGKGISFHGPHTVPPITMSHILESLKGRKTLYTIHLAESELELEFLREGKGPWADLMAERGHALDLLGPFGGSSVQRLKEVGLLSPNTILVHCHHLEEGELDLIRERGCFVCLCPRSSLRLHGIVIEIREFLKRGIPICLGTDSLASAPSLSVWDEMRYLLSHYPYLSPGDVFSMATTNAAKALGLEGYTLLGSSLSSLLYLDCQIASADPLASAIFGASHKTIKWLGAQDAL